MEWTSLSMRFNANLIETFFSGGVNMTVSVIYVTDIFFPLLHELNYHYFERFGLGIIHSFL